MKLSLYHSFPFQTCYLTRIRHVKWKYLRINDARKPFKEVHHPKSGRIYRMLLIIRSLRRSCGSANRSCSQIFASCRAHDTSRPNNLFLLIDFCNGRHCLLTIYWTVIRYTMNEHFYNVFCIHRIIYYFGAHWKVPFR